MTNAVTAQCAQCGHIEVLATAGYAVRLPDGTYYPLPTRQKLDAVRHLGLDPRAVDARHDVMRWSRWQCARCGHAFDRYFPWAPTGCVGCALPLLGLALALWLLPWSWPMSGPLGLIAGTAALTWRSRRADARAAQARPDLPTPAQCPRCDAVEVHDLRTHRGPAPCPQCGAAALRYAPLRSPGPTRPPPE
jgi:hypothetical protein